MYITFDTIINAAAVLGAVVSIAGIVYGIIKWFQRQNNSPAEIEKLKEVHDKDIRELKDELCELTFAMLATLNGLKQLNCNGQVTEAYNRLSKHLNKQAHDQN